MLYDDALRAASEYLKDKGYENVRTHAWEEVDGIPVWYFYYNLPEGQLELEVEWDGWRWHWNAMFLYDSDVT